jgi:hypothetical protein
LSPESPSKWTKDARAEARIKEPGVEARVEEAAIEAILEAVETRVEETAIEAALETILKVVQSAVEARVKYSPRHRPHVAGVDPARKTPAHVLGVKLAGSPQPCQECQSANTEE